MEQLIYKAAPIILEFGMGLHVQALHKLMENMFPCLSKPITNSTVKKPFHCVKTNFKDSPDKNSFVSGWEG